MTQRKGLNYVGGVRMVERVSKDNTFPVPPSNIAEKNYRLNSFIDHIGKIQEAIIFFSKPVPIRKNSLKEVHWISYLN